MLHKLIEATKHSKKWVYYKKLFLHHTSLQDEFRLDSLLSLSVLDQYEEENAKIYLIELATGELKPAIYSLYIFTEDMNNQPISYAKSTFPVR